MFYFFIYIYIIRFLWGSFLHFFSFFSLARYFIIFLSFLCSFNIFLLLLLFYIYEFVSKLEKCFTNNNNKEKSQYMQQTEIKFDFHYWVRLLVRLELSKFQFFSLSFFFFSRWAYIQLFISIAYRTTKAAQFIEQANREREWIMYHDIINRWISGFGPFFSFSRLYYYFLLLFSLSFFILLFQKKRREEARSSGYFFLLAHKRRRNLVQFIFIRQKKMKEGWS